MEEEQPWWEALWNQLSGSESLNAMIRIAVIIVAVIVLRWILIRVVRRLVNRVVKDIKVHRGVLDTQALSSSPVSAMRAVQRTRTLGSVMNNFITWALIILGLILILDTLGFSVTALVASAGVIGAALAFGAQHVIKDALNGMFMVLEDQLGVGDLVDLGEATGIVEEVGIRITKIRDVNGTLWSIRNGEVIRVGNMSHGWARIVLDIEIPYDSDLDQIQRLLLETTAEIGVDPDWQDKVLEEAEIWGLESVTAEAMILRLVMKVQTSAKYPLARELRARVKQKLDGHGIKLPALNSVVLRGESDTGTLQAQLQKQEQVAEDSGAAKTSDGTQSQSSTSSTSERKGAGNDRNQ